MDTRLDYWPLSTNPLLHRGRAEKLAEQGWRGLSIQSTSPFERRRIRAFCRERFGDDYWMSKQTFTRERLSKPRRGEYHDFDFGVWAKDETHIVDLVDFLKTLPQRSCEIVLPLEADEEAVGRMLRGRNHRIVEVYDYEENRCAEADLIDVLLVSTEPVPDSLLVTMKLTFT